ncbi:MULTISPECIES: helix-turn-helix domain-containing protein [Deinococcus]|uniref:Helix-turn-helix domain-containing protein n=1 Tax=Deinococcus rufus TaxID=2136097 RepID=A0ABV7ZAM6_9DEIO|nr:helix-turn-helix domain-containing protein [Deinococcus sp. AB2017081]WQE94676.1 helix-turn-helix domain-containing protein [Deinococcus sp. AB2017081]
MPDKKQPDSTKHTYLTPAEVCAELRVSRAVYDAAARSGELDVKRFSRRIHRIHRDEMTRWFNGLGGNE